MIIPYQQLSAEVLTAILEEFVSREGTDYGEVEASFSDKVSDLHVQLERGDVVVVFDVETESVSLMTAQAARELESFS